MEQAKPLTLDAAQDELAHVEAQIAAARRILAPDSDAGGEAQRQAIEELAYYGQLATRYRAEVARLLRERKDHD